MPKTAAELQSEIDRWNDRVAVGDLIVYRSAPREEIVLAKVREKAWILSGHTAVVNVESVAGCIALGNCRPAGPDDRERYRTVEAVIAERDAARSAPANLAFEAWWTEQTSVGDPAKRHGLIREAFVAGYAAAKGRS